MTDLASVEGTIFAAGNRLMLSVTTRTCLLLGIGPNRSMLTLDQAFSGTFCDAIGSFVYLGLNNKYSLQLFTSRSAS